MTVPDPAAGAGGTGPSADVAPPPDLQWHRPHPFTLVAELVASLRSFIPAILVAQGDVFGEGIATEVIVAVLPLASAIGRWWTTRYALDVEALHHHHGLLWRKRQVLPRSNIQNVSTRAGLIARLGSVVELHVSDASANGEIAIRFVTAEEADRLTTLLRDPAGADRSAPDGHLAPGHLAPGGLSAGAVPPGEDDVGVGTGRAVTTSSGGVGDDPPSGSSGPAGPPVARPPLVEVATGDLVRAELTSLGALAPLPGMVLVPALVYLTLGNLEQNGAGPPGGAALWAAASTVTPLLGSLSYVISRVVAVGDFRLVADPDRLRIRVGLLTEARVTARRERVQQIRVIRQALHRRLGLERVEYETADTEVQDALATGYLSPVGPSDGWIGLAREVFGGVEPNEDDLQPVSPLTRRRVLVRFGLVTAPLAMVTAVAQPMVGVVLAAAGIGLGWWYGRERHRVLGWALAESQILIRRGVVDQTLTLVRTSKIQSLGLRESYFQRRLGLATLRFSTAGRGDRGQVTLPDLPREVAEELLAQLAHRSAATPIADTL